MQLLFDDIDRPGLHTLAVYRRERERREDGKWHARTSRMACEEDLEDMLARNWAEAWRPLAVPVALVRSTLPIDGGFIVPEAERDGIVATAASVTVTELEITHADVLTDEATWAAVGAHLA